MSWRSGRVQGGVGHRGHRMALPVGRRAVRGRRSPGRDPTPRLSWLRPGDGVVVGVCALGACSGPGVAGVGAPRPLRAVSGDARAAALVCAGTPGGCGRGDRRGVGARGRRGGAAPDRRVAGGAAFDRAGLAAAVCQAGGAAGSLACCSPAGGCLGPPRAHPGQGVGARLDAARPRSALTARRRRHARSSPGTAGGPSDRAEQIALFRYRVVAEAANPRLTPAERGRLVRALARQAHEHPNGALTPARCAAIRSCSPSPPAPPAATRPAGQASAGSATCPSAASCHTRAWPAPSAPDSSCWSTTTPGC